MNAQLITANDTAQRLPATQGDADFNLAYRRAKAMSSSSLVPKEYQNNIPNTLIALELADRIGASPMQIMQNLHIIQGRPSLSSSFLIATVNACGRFTPLRFEVVGTDPSKDDYRVRAFAEDKAGSHRCLGAWITWAMVKAEGWSKKNGSKWLTMPEQMFMYRAAAFWARVYAPEVSQGIHTSEEVGDVWGTGQVVPAGAGVAHEAGSLQSLEAQLTGQEAPSETASELDPEPQIVTFDEAINRIRSAADRDVLDDAYSLVDLYQPAERQILTEAYNQRADELQLP